MSAKRILSVGQCDADHQSIGRMLTQHFDVAIVPADDAEEAQAKLREESFDLVLVNRVFDCDGGCGLELIRAICSDKEAPTVMLVSNYEDKQQEAMSAGAVRGFGKGALGHPATIARLQTYLSDQPAKARS
jgi:CheY-like chemotaxis protein